MSRTMEIDREALRRHYESMGDEELLDLDPNELTDVARQFYEQEMQSRNLAGSAEAEAEEDFSDSGGPAFEAEPDWIETAAIACAFHAVPGSAEAPKAAHACDVLRAAGVPCHIDEVPPDPEDESGSRFTEYRVMVPGALSLIAASILDKEIFNVEQEADWKTHLEALSDEELRLLNPAAICEGFLDRAARLKRVYENELNRRR